MIRSPLLRSFLAFAILLPAAFAGDLRVGVARVDITPDYAVRLSGYGFRRAESDGVTQRIWAKAIAFADEQNGPAILITTDNLGVPDEITRTVAGRLALKRERLTITASHTHTAPMLRGVAPTLFGVPIPGEHQAAIDRYTREFTDALVEVALAAVKDIRPARVEWGIGRVGFAKNRRTPGGPVDHDLPLLVVREVAATSPSQEVPAASRRADQKVRAIWFSYACHCTVLGINIITGDWAGYAMEEIQRDFPGAVALMSAGCGGDANPAARETVEAAAQQGRDIADEVKRALAAPLTPITAPPAMQSARIDLAFDTPRTRILDPSAAIEPRFVSHIVAAKDGRTFIALIRAETATSLTLAQPGGLVATLLRTDAREVLGSKMSLMPEGLEETISPQDMADLLAFLRAGTN